MIRFMYCYAECHYAECRLLSVIMLSVVMLKVVAPIYGPCRLDEK